MRCRWPIVVVAATLLAAGCAGDDDGAVATTGTDTGEPASTQPTEPESTEPESTETTEPEPTEPTEPPETTEAPTTTVAEPVVGEPSVALAEVGRFDQAVDLVTRPDDAAFYVVEQPGRVVRVDDTGATLVADLTDRVGDEANEQGLLGIEFSADGALAYLNYTNNQGDTTVAEYPVAADGAFDIAAERVLLVVEQPYGNHNGGDLARGPDGMLYIALGDGGAGGDPERRADDPAVLLGSLLRIDPTPSGDAPYTIPDDNPFADGDGGAPEVWAWGLRNPWRIAFDPVTADLWIADVGQNRWEEINHVPAAEGGAARGADFGWSAFEGSERFNDDVPDPGNTVMPVFTYGRDAGCSISGGEPYRGTEIPELAPAFVYSDYCAGTLWAFDPASGRNLVLAEDVGSVSAIRRGPANELYVLTLDGPILQLTPA